MRGRIMRVLIKGRALAAGELNERGFVDLPVDTSGRGDVVKLAVFPDRETNALPAVGRAMLEVKAGQQVEVTCDVYVNKNGQLGCRPVSL